MKKLAWIALGVLVAAGVGAGIWLSVKRLGVDDGMYSRAMAAGMPLEPEQVWIEEPPSAEEDAGPLMVQAAEAFASLEIESEGIVRLALGTRAEAGRARQELQQAKPVLDLIDEACKRPDARIVRDWALGPNLFLRELPVFKGICQLLTARAMLSIREGRFDAGVNDLERAYHFAYLVGREPNLIAMLVRISSEMIVQSGIRAAADQTTTPEQIAKLRQVVEKGHQELSLFHHIRTELTMSAAAARNPDNQTELKQISAATKTGEMADDPRLIRSGPPEDKKMRAILNIALAKWMPLFELGEDAWDNAKAGPVLKRDRARSRCRRKPAGQARRPLRSLRHKCGRCRNPAQRRRQRHPRLPGCPPIQAGKGPPPQEPR